MTFFTSINNYYLAKARVLAKSVKKYMPDAYFVLVLADKTPDLFNIDNEPFDELILIENLELPVENKNMWFYMHSVVELCTAVKGQALYELLIKHEKVAYLDPDIVVYNDLAILDKLLDSYDIILTPHQTVPEKNDRDIINNEITFLIRGTYNFGFFAVRSNENGINYAKWFRDRLLKYCKDDESRGLFTDQKWGDLAPALFDNLYIWKHPGANVSTWNITHRFITKRDNKYFSNGEPLLFYHFSGFDSGAQLSVLNIYSKGNPVLYELRNIYINEQGENGQIECSKIKCFYNIYNDNKIIKPNERHYLRDNPNIQIIFNNSNPFLKGKNSYFSFLHNPIRKITVILSFSLKKYGIKNTIKKVIKKIFKLK
jgi:hypothetical protein